MASRPVPRASRVQVEGSVRDINDYYYEQGWTDGLPIIPPTEDLVLEMVEDCSLSAGHSFGQMAPLNGSVTVEKVAINSVMAGCQPDYFPMVLAAVKAVLQPQFNVGSITTTTGGAAPVVVVSGPIAQRLGIHSGTAVFGSGHQANATIGRALRLTMRNMGGATVATMEKSTHGWPGKYTMCFAEAAKRCPWEPLHVEMGYPAEASIVTVAAVRGIQTLVEGAQETGEGVLETVVGAVQAMGISGFYYQQRGGLTRGSAGTRACGGDSGGRVQSQGRERVSLRACQDTQGRAERSGPLGRSAVAGGVGAAGRRLHDSYCRRC